jgi:hypothetical protein
MARTSYVLMRLRWYFFYSRQTRWVWFVLCYACELKQDKYKYTYAYTCRCTWIDYLDQLVINITPIWCMAIRETSNANYIVYGLTSEFLPIPILSNTIIIIPLRRWFYVEMQCSIGMNGFYHVSSTWYILLKVQSLATLKHLI